MPRYIAFMHIPPGICRLASSAPCGRRRILSQGVRIRLARRPDESAFTMDGEMLIDATLICVSPIPSRCLERDLRAFMCHHLKGGPDDDQDELRRPLARGTPRP